MKIVSEKEQDLARRLKDNDDKVANKAFEEIFMLEFPKFVILAKGYGFVEAEAEDITIEILEALYRNKQNLVPEKGYFSYLYKSFLNKMIEFLRMSSAKREAKRKAIATMLERTEQILLISKAISWLEGECKDGRDILVDKFIKEISYKKIAQKMGISLYELYRKRDEAIEKLKNFLEY